MCLTIYFKNSIAKYKIIEQIVFFTTFYLLIQGINLVPGGRELQTTTIRGGGRGGRVKGINI